MTISQNTKINILVLIFFSLITLIITWPLIFNLSSLIIDPYDGLLINWIINWSINNPLNLNANIFFPFGNTLAYSDFHLISVITSAPFVILFKEPLLAANINFLLGFVLTGFSTYLLTKHLTKDISLSLLCGTLFSFGTIHINYMDHLQLFGFWPFIFSVYFYLKNRNALFVLFSFLSVATMPLNFFFLFLFFIFAPKRNWKAFLLALALSLFVFVPYYLVSNEFNYVRPITDSIHNSLKIHTFFESNINSRLSLFTGAGTLIILALLFSFKPKINRYLLLSLVALILSFGPAFHVFKDTVEVGPLPFIPMPYAIFYYLLPGFSGFRTPSRWILLSFFAFVIGLSLVLKNRLGKKIIALLILLIVLEVNFPLTYTKIPTLNKFPPEQIWLQNNYSGAPLIQFPIYGWFDKEKIGVETLRMHYSIAHKHPMFNGYSGFSPQVWEKDVQWLQKEFPSDKTIDYLRKAGIKLILTPEVLEFKEVKLVKSFPNTNIYAIGNNNYK